MKTQSNFMQKRNVLLVVLLAIFTLALTLATLTGFASKKSVFAEGENGDAIKGINLSLNEDIVVKIHTRNVEGDYLVVNFNGKDTEIVENENGIFAFNGVTPQYMTETMTITLFNGEEEIDSNETCVKDYLKTLAVAEYDEKYGSPMQYDAMRELAINLLNYGAAAQNYKDVNLDKLANDDADINWDLGTPELKVNETDKAATDNDTTDAYYWIQAGVRFDYKLGLFFVFNADSVDGITLKINGEDATFAPYGNSGTQYIAYYNAFSATQMNKVINAVLFNAESEELCACTYSIKSYVNSKQNAENTEFANLVKATYGYGYAAVAYANVVYTAPTAEKDGSVALKDNGGFNYADSKYAEVVLPAFNATDYDATTTFNDTTGEGLATATLSFINDARYVFTCNVNDAFELDGKYYTQYDLAKSGVSVARGESEYTLSGEVNAKRIAVYGAGFDLVIDGATVVISAEAQDGLHDAIEVKEGKLTLIDANINATSADQNYSAINAAGVEMDANSALSIEGFEYGVYLREGENHYFTNSLTFKNLRAAAFGSYFDSEVTLENANLYVKDNTAPIVHQGGDSSVVMTILGTTTANEKIRTVGTVNIGNAEKAGNFTVESSADAIAVRGGMITVVNGTLTVNKTGGDVTTGIKLDANDVALKVDENGSLAINGFYYSVGSWDRNNPKVRINGTANLDGQVFINNGSFKVDGANAQVNVGGTLTVTGDNSTDRLYVRQGKMTVKAPNTDVALKVAKIQVGAKSDLGIKGYLTAITHNSDIITFDGIGATAATIDVYGGELNIFSETRRKTAINASNVNSLNISTYDESQSKIIGANFYAFLGEWGECTFWVGIKNNTLVMPNCSTLVDGNVGGWWDSDGQMENGANYGWYNVVNANLTYSAVSADIESVDGKAVYVVKGTYNAIGYGDLLDNFCLRNVPLYLQQSGGSWSMAGAFYAFDVSVENGNFVAKFDVTDLKNHNYNIWMTKFGGNTEANDFKPATAFNKTVDVNGTNWTMKVVPGSGAMEDGYGNVTIVIG